MASEWDVSGLRNAVGLAAVLRDRFDEALLYRDLATLRTDAPLFHDSDELRWRGPTDAFADCVKRLGEHRLLKRSVAAQKTAQ
jgi:5'-3' exonuclease